jgi:hypothetical protein
MMGGITNCRRSPCQRRALPARKVYWIPILFFTEALARKQDSTIQGVRQTTVSSANLHCDDDKFRNHIELCGQGGIDTRVTETQANGTVGRYNLKEDAKQCKIRVATLNARSLGDRDDKQPEEDKPQIKGQLTPKMGSNIRRIGFVFAFFGIAGVDAKGLFFVHIGSPD